MVEVPRSENCEPGEKKEGLLLKKGTVLNCGLAIRSRSAASATGASRKQIVRSWRMGSGGTTQGTPVAAQEAKRQQQVQEGTAAAITSSERRRSPK